MRPYTFPINSNMLPSGLPSGSTYNIDLGLNNPQYIALGELFATGEIKNIQSVWVDNSQNNYSLIINVKSTYQNIIVPSYYQGVFPLLINSNLTGEIEVSSPNSIAQVILILLDIPLDYFLYNTQGSVLGTANVEVVNASTAPVPVNVVDNTATSPIYVDVMNTSVPVDITNTTSAPVPVNLPANTSTAPLYVDVTNNTSIISTIPFIPQSSPSTVSNLPWPIPFAGNTMSAIMTASATNYVLSVVSTNNYVFPTSFTFIISSNATLTTAGIETINIGWATSSTTSQSIAFSFGVYIGSTGGAELSDKVITIPSQMLNVTSDYLIVATLSSTLATGQITAICNYGYFNAV